MLTNACKYAIRAILYLAINSDETKKIGVKVIAADLETPQPFLAKLLQKLAHDNLVSSAKGPHGGFYLTKNNKEKTVWDVIKCIDNTDKFDSCFLGLAKCDDKNPCPVHFIVASFKQSITESFRNKTMTEYASEIKNTRQVISLKNVDLLKMTRP